MTETILLDLQASVMDTTAFHTLADYFQLCSAFLGFCEQTQRRALFHRKRLNTFSISMMRDTHTGLLVP